MRRALRRGRLQQLTGGLRARPHARRHRPTDGIVRRLPESLSIHVAARDGDRELVALLLERGVDVNYVDKRGCTALHHAAENGHSELANFLLAHGAAVDVVDGAGFTSLEVALWGSHLDVVCSLLRAGARPTLEAAVVLGDVSSLRQLLATGADANARGAGGYAPLHWTAALNRLLAASVLLEHGADPNLPTEWDRESPLHIAALHGHADVGRLLVESGANVEATNTAGRTALDLSLAGKHRAIADLLRAHAGQ